MSSFIFYFRFIPKMFISKIAWTSNRISHEEILRNSMREEDFVITQNSKNIRWGPHHPGAIRLKQLYSRGKRIEEFICISISTLMIIIDFYFILSKVSYNLNLGSLLTPIVGGILTVDFLSGFLHWAADTWGCVDFPIFGPHLLRRFREHHIDPTTITRQDFIQINGDNFTAAIPFLGWVMWSFMTCEMEDNCQELFSFSCYVFCIAIFGVFTNQIHKWSHTYSGLPPWVEWLQDHNFILSRKHHRIHHVAPHETHYCITTGWLNWPLEKIHFWKILEVLIERATGCKPRSDDLKWACVDVM